MLVDEIKTDLTMLRVAGRLLRHQRERCLPYFNQVQQIRFWLSELCADVSGDRRKGGPV